METMNWIEKIKEAVHVAMSKKALLSGYEDKCEEVFQFYIGKDDGTIKDEGKIVILCFKKAISISTSKGYIRIEYTFSDRDNLELQALVLSIKEYRENMAISELNKFISEKEDEITDINNLYDDD